jgi:hypothetical protein
MEKETVQDMEMRAGSALAVDSTSEQKDMTTEIEEDIIMTKTDTAIIHPITEDIIITIIEDIIDTTAIITIIIVIIIMGFAMDPISPLLRTTDTITAKPQPHS